MVVGFTNTCAISAYQFESRSWRGVQHYVIKFVSGRWFSPGPPVSSTNKTGRHDITEILLKMALDPIKTKNKLITIDTYQTVGDHVYEQCADVIECSLMQSMIQNQQAWHI